MLCRALALPMLAVALMAASVPPVSPPVLLTAGQARQVAEVLDADASAEAIGKLCPAEAYGRLTDRLNTQTDETAFCEREPVACAKKCLALSSAEHCFRLALVLSFNGHVVRPVYTMRLFALACEHDDSWGCAMLGQSFALGEGTVRDEAAARRFYKRSCEIAERNSEPDFEACRFSRNNLAELKAR